MIEFRMPSLGADMEDGVFVEWRVETGARVERGQVVCVVETQKGAIEVEIWDAGTIATRIAEPGQRIPVGQAMAIVAADGEDWQAIAAARVAAASASPAAPAAPSAPAATPAAAGAAVASTSPVGRPSVAAGLPPRASPAARKRAAELGVDLDALAVATAGAPISVADVERAAAAPPPPVSPRATAAAAPPAPAAPPAAPPVAPPAAAPTAGLDPEAAMRAAIAAAMSRSKREIPHYYLGTEIDVEAAHRWLERFNATQPLAGRVLFAALALRAVALALHEVPDLNGQFADGRFRRSEAIHVGVVTSLRGGGIVVPAVHDADRLALPELMASLRDVLARARSGRLRSSDLADSTITVTNLGDLGVETVYGVIYPPQVALVGLGRVLARPVVRDGAVVAARTMTATLSGDHRVTDGLTGARFLSALRERLAHPEAS